MVELSTYGSGEGRGWETGPGYSTQGFLVKPAFHAAQRNFTSFGSRQKC
jgi:hypothetical protein